MAENVYALIAPDVQSSSQHARYRSQYSDAVRQEYTAHKETTKTMGPAKVALDSPTQYMKKGEGVAPVKHTAEHAAFTSTKPPVPRHDELLTTAGPTSKNFLQDNTMTTIRAVPKKPEPAILDVAHGRGGRQVLDASGLVPKYTKKEDFGKVPEYLQRRKEEDALYQQQVESQYQTMARAGAPRKLSDTERSELLRGLKANWAQLHHDYQGLSVVVDTESKKHRKKSMEEQLAHLEADIQRIERHPVIYVED